MRVNLPVLFLASLLGAATLALYASPPPASATEVTKKDEKGLGRSASAPSKVFKKSLAAARRALVLETRAIQRDCRNDKLNAKDALDRLTAANAAYHATAMEAQSDLVRKLAEIGKALAEKLGDPPCDLLRPGSGSPLESAYKDALDQLSRSDSKIEAIVDNLRAALRKKGIVVHSISCGTPKVGVPIVQPAVAGALTPSARPHAVLVQSTTQTELDGKLPGKLDVVLLGVKPTDEWAVEVLLADDFGKLPPAPPVIKGTGGGKGTSGLLVVSIDDLLPNTNALVNFTATETEGEGPPVAWRDSILIAIPDGEVPEPTCEHPPTSAFGGSVTVNVDGNEVLSLPDVSITLTGSSAGVLEAVAFQAGGGAAGVLEFEFVPPPNISATSTFQMFDVASAAGTFTDSQGVFRVLQANPAPTAEFSLVTSAGDSFGEGLHCGAVELTMNFVAFAPSDSSTSNVVIVVESDRYAWAFPPSGCNGADVAFTYFDIDGTRVASIFENTNANDLSISGGVIDQLSLGAQFFNGNDADDKIAQFIYKPDGGIQNGTFSIDSTAAPFLTPFTYSADGVATTGDPITKIRVVLNVAGVPSAAGLTPGTTIGVNIVLTLTGTFFTDIRNDESEGTIRIEVCSVKVRSP